MLVAGGLLAASVLLHVRDPHQSGSWGFCPWLVLTGTYCPGCGGLRAVNDLTGATSSAAASSNLLFVAVAARCSRWWVDPFATGRAARRESRRRSAYVVLVAVLAVTVLFWVVRNLPGLTWRRPDPATPEPLGTGVEVERRDAALDQEDVHHRSRSPIAQPTMPSTTPV